MKSLITVKFLFALTFLFACRQKPSENISQGNSANMDSDHDTLITYQSSSNGSADIKLTMLTNNTFNFYMQIMPQPMTNDEETTVNATGIWKNKNGFTQLIFLKNRPILNAVFDTQYSNGKDFTVLNDSIVNINNKLNSFYIWGVLCEKTEKQTP